MTRICEMIASERPRERLWNGGADTLKTSELIAILLRTGLKGKSALVLGEEILHRYPSLNDLCRASALELSKIKGVGMAKAVQLKAAFELAARLAASRRNEQPVETAQDVHRLLGDEMRLLPYESLRVLPVNARYHLLAVKEISRGTTDGTIGLPRDVLKIALEHHACAFFIVHNHPSGDPLPSNEDRDFTSQLRRAAQLLEVQLLDHVILGVPSATQPEAYYSFKEAGYL
ncbi:MAG: DNA repair protein RadC [bacterium]